ncbi:SpoIIE family protein phosphatase [Thiohalocapsa marina]|nr:SpoIIE family protein phosphatase [Thiohalocapsa marina]
MLLWTVGISGLILIGLLLWNYVSFRDRLTQSAQDRASFLAEGSADKIDAKLGPLQGAVDTLALTLEAQSLDLPPERVRLLQRRLLETFPGLYGTALGMLPQWRPPGWETPGAETLVPYSYREGDRILYADLGADDRRYLGQDWMNLPRYLGRAVWTEPYIEKTGVKMVTYAVPLTLSTPDGPVFVGVVTGDVELSWLDRQIAELPLGERGYGLLMSRNGTYITHPKPGLAFNESVFSIAEARGDEGLRKVGQAMTSGEPGRLPWVSWATGDKSWLSWDVLGTTGWTVGTLVSQSALHEQILQLTRLEAVVGGAGLLLLVLAVGLVARSITRPISALSEAAPQLSAGNLDTPLPTPRGNDEVAQLTRTFRRMRDDLKRYIADLEETTAERERVNGELRIAHDIQMDLVPKTFPAFPDRGDMDLHAIMVPAREVGGDFYDFMLLDEQHMVLAIADVSGKGVPAAMFMAVTRSLLRSEFKVDADPGRVLERVNETLAENNDSCMFVTLFCAVVNLSTGDTRYANAGHNPPILLRANGEPEWISRPYGTVAGPMPDMVYETGHLRLENGDALLLYTDGVNEAMDGDNREYGNDRLIARLRACGALGCKDCLRTLLDDLRRHAGEAPQSDDITLMMFRKKAPGAPHD